MEIIHLHIVPENATRCRLSDAGNMAFEGLYTKSAFKKMITRQEVMLNGTIGKTGDWVSGGDKIELLASKVKVPKILQLEIEVLFEDEHIAVINKPAGIAVSGNQYRTVQNALGHALEQSREEDALAIARPAHRLDALTSGLLLIGKTSSALLGLNEQFEQQTIHKKYVALVLGEIAAKGEIEIPINGKESVTTFVRLSMVKSLKSESISLVELRPKTGRTHQLRRHLSGIGHPILGDELYTQDQPLLKGKGLFLSAVAISFIHPKTGEDMSLELPMPPKFSRRMKYEQKRWNKFN